MVELLARPRRLSRPAGFVVATSVLVLFQAASSAPAPLYVVYQGLWGFSAATLTLVFAIFVFGLLGALLLLGGWSDRVGRRPVLLAAIGLEAAALLLFLTAWDVTALLVARLAQGVATGTALPAIGATLVDLEPPRAPGRAAVVSGVVPVGGMAVGALACGSLAQYAPDPTHLVWAVLLGLAALASALVLALPESSARRDHGARSWGVPRRLRGEVCPLMPIIVASWALGGLYLSLGPSVVASIFGISDHFVGGLVVTLLCGIGAVSAFVLRGRSGLFVARISTSLVAVGTAVTVLGAVTVSVPFAILGTAISGIGYGASGPAAFGALARLAGPADAAERAGLFAVAYTVAFLAFSLPAVVAGYAATVVGLPATVIGYAALVIAVGLGAFAAGRARRRSR